jgi:acetyl-CoA synthetase
MTRGLLGAPGRYLDSYWRRWPGMWAHGDWASRDADGAWFVHGRSDETMNLAGKRTGPAEIETVLLGHPQVAEAAAFGVQDQAKGEALWCAVVPVAAGPGASPTAAGPGTPARDDEPYRLLRGTEAAAPAGEHRTGEAAAGHDRDGGELAGELRQLVASRLGAAFRPARVLIVPGLPRTRSGKVMRGLLTGLASGRGAGDSSAMAEPALAGQLEVLLSASADEQTGSNPSDRT